jgi:ribosome-binding protein aMBF1 (putative translation factor)
MQVAVRTPHTEFVIDGSGIPKDFIDDIRKRFGKDNVTLDNEDEKDIFKTDWFKNFGNGYTPAVALKTNRKSIRGWTQKELAEKLNIPVQYVSNMETGIRPISVKMADKLGKVFGIDPIVFMPKIWKEQAQVSSI